MSGDPPASGGWLPPSDREWRPPEERRENDAGAMASWPGGSAERQGQRSSGPPRSNGHATMALIFGVIGLIVCPFVMSVLALVFGYQARREIDTAPGTYTNRGMAIAGIVLGWIGLAFGITIAIYLLAGGSLTFDDANGSTALARA